MIVINLYGDDELIVVEQSDKTEKEEISLEKEEILRQEILQKQVININGEIVTI